MVTGEMVAAQRAEFFSAAGEMESHRVFTGLGFTGERRGKDCAIVVFEYPHGMARYDGAGREFWLEAPAHTDEEWEALVAELVS